MKNALKSPVYLRFLSLFVALSFSGPSFATNNSGFLKPNDERETKLHERVDDFLKGSFRIRENIDFILDGTEAASGLDRKSSIRSELVYYSPTQWRVRRERPFDQKAREFVRLGRIFTAKPSGQLVAADGKFPVPDSTWIELILSPQKLAETWSLVDPNLKFAYWLEQLKGGRLKSQNINGDSLRYEDLKNGNFKISYQGKVLHDAKTQIIVRGTWILTDHDKISEKDLKVSLMK